MPSFLARGDRSDARDLASFPGLVPRHSAGIIGRRYAFSSTRTHNTIVSMRIINQNCHTYKKKKDYEQEAMNNV